MQNESGGVLRYASPSYSERLSEGWPVACRFRQVLWVPFSGLSWAARSCLLFAAPLDGARITTVEGLARDGEPQPIHDAFHENHALQCGYCTPGFVVTVHELLADNPDPTEAEVREALAGNLCRCTGYINIIKAVLDAAGRLRVTGQRPVLR